MSTFSDIQLAETTAPTFRSAFVVTIEYEPVLRLWNGNQPIEIGGNMYNGTGGLGTIDGLKSVRGGESSQVRLTLSGTLPELKLLAAANVGAQVDKFCSIGVQIFNKNWERVGDPQIIFTGLTQPLQVSRQSAPPGEKIMRTVTLPVENFFFGRSRIEASYYTAQDQRRLFPNDSFLDSQHLMLSGLTHVWPLA